MTAWFELNAANAHAETRDLLYSDIPLHYTWSTKTREWKKRTDASAAHKVIGRLHGAQPGEGDRFYLFLLLLKSRGATSFQDLCTVDGQAYFDIVDGETKYCWDEAAIAKGVVESTDQYMLALEAAAEEKMPK